MKGKGFAFRLFVASLFASYLSIVAIPIPFFKAVKADAPVLSASKAECVIEMNSRRVLYEEHGDIRLPMASTTKILTCATVLELCNNLQTEFSIPPEAVGVEGSSVYLKAGEIYTVEDLLYGLMLRSGNDCATALALYCSDSIANFSVQMNKVAQKAGALASNFENPHGLPNRNHYTTARDLSFISAYAMQHPTFEKIVSTQYYEKCGWKNKNKMLYRYDGTNGIKTGYTKEAGRCLVTAAKKGDMTLICTVLNCPAMYERSAKLLDDAFSAYEYVQLLSKDKPIEIADTKICGYVDKNYYYPLLPEERDLVEIRTKSHDKKTVNNLEIVGEFEIYLAKRLLFSGNLYKL